MHLRTITMIEMSKVLQILTDVVKKPERENGFGLAIPAKGVGTGRTSK